MARAIWNGAVLAESEKFEKVEGNIYFPPDSIDRQYFKHSNSHTSCLWKGRASYYDIEVNGERNSDAAWYYPEPEPKAKNIKNHIAFWKGVSVQE